MPADLLKHNCIVFDHSFQWAFKNKSTEQVIEVSGKVNTNMVAVMIAMTLQHMGITLLPIQLLREQLASGELVEIFHDYTILYPQLDVKEVFVLYSNRKHLPAKVKAFIDFYRDKI